MTTPVCFFCKCIASMPQGVSRAGAFVSGWAFGIGMDERSGLAKLEQACPGHKREIAPMLAMGSGKPVKGVD